MSMRQFSLPHLAALAVLLITTPAAITCARRWPGAPTWWLGRSLAGLIFAAWVGEYLADLITGIWRLRYDLPLQLTDTISVVSVCALITRRRTLVELTFMWALSASLQATITPDLDWTFPSGFYFTYFIYHEGAIVAGLMLVFGCGLYPRRGAWARTVAATLVVATAAGAADAAIPGADYMFLASKPPYGSLLDVLGPWPWYIASITVVAAAMVLMLQALAGAIARRDPASPGPPAAPRSALSRRRAGANSRADVSTCGDTHVGRGGPG